ncbi:MAG: hypothetical protein QXD25_00095 [Nanopusillaceae archaeon]
MGIFDKIFGKTKKEKEIKEEGKEKEKEIIDTCSVCNRPIYKNEEYKTLNFQGNKYIVHVKCFRKAKKMAKKYLGGGIKI